MFRIVGTDAASGTSLRGFVLGTFGTLVEKLGPPPRSRDPETPACWTLQFDDGTISTLYCYTQRPIPTHFETWHVGGHSGRAVRNLALALGAELLDLRDFYELHFFFLRTRREKNLGATYAWVDPTTAESDDDGVQIPF